MGARGAPGPGGRRAGAAGGVRPPGEARLVPGAHAVCPAACCLAYPAMARGDGHAVGRGTVPGGGLEHRDGPSGALEARGVARIPHALGGEAAKPRTGMWRAGQHVLQGLGDRPCPIPQTASAQPHDHAAPRPGRVPHRDSAQRAPSAVGAHAGYPGAWEQGGRLAGSARGPLGLDARRAAVTAPRAARRTRSG
jgi:hypothetical protein